MRALVNTAPGQMAWRELPLPQPGPGQVRVRTAACAICATDLRMIAGWSRTTCPAIPGHEWSGVVDAVGPGVAPELAGRPCVAENVLSDGGEVGFEHPGGYGEFLLTEARNVRALPAGMDLDQAALIEPLAVCVRMIKRLTHSNVFEPHHHRFGRTLILGDGPIGLLTTALLRSAVSSRSNRDAAEDITLVGGKPNRLELARQFGADTVINYHDLPTSDLARSILNATACLPGRRESDADQRTGSRKPVAGSRGRGPSRAIPVPSSQVPIPGSRFPVPGSRFHVIIEASGSPAAIDACLDLAAPGGRIMVIGDYADATAGFPWNRLLHKELELIGSNASANAWDEAVALACAGAVPLGKLITHRLPADRFAEGVELMRVRKPDVIKVVLQWT